MLISYSMYNMLWNMGKNRDVIILKVRIKIVKFYIIVKINKKLR